MQLISHVRYLYGQLQELRHSILGSYRAYIYKVARYDAEAHALPTDMEDMAQNYFLAADKAMNHFNIQKGAFKSYLDVWIKKARNSGNHFYGSAYRVPSGIKANHLYVPLSELHDAEPDDDDHTPQALYERYDEVNLVRRLASLVDPGGYALQALGSELILEQRAS